MSDAFFSALAGRSGASLAAEGATRRAGPAAMGRQAAMTATGRHEALRVNDMASKEEGEIKKALSSCFGEICVFAYSEFSPKENRCEKARLESAASVAR